MRDFPLYLPVSCGLPFERRVFRYGPTIAMHLRSLLWVLPVAVRIAAAVTVYSQIPLHQATKTTSAIPANNTAHATYDPKNLNPPILPNLLSTQFSLSLGATNTTQSGLSMPVPGSFYGFSVEMSVANQICEFLQYQFIRSNAH